MNHNISILGCGWLGFPLAQELSKQGFEIKGSTTSPSKLPLLEENGISPYLINLEDVQLNDTVLNAFLENCDILIVAIPPRFKQATTAYNTQLGQLLPYLKRSPVKRVIFMSSTSVYACQPSIITEATPTNPETNSGKLIVEVENLFRSETSWKTTILRLGGLYGPQRHPVTFICKKSVFENPDLSVNMISQQEVIAFTAAIINREQTDTCCIYNLVTPHHQTRKEFYGIAAVKMGLELPPATTTDWSLEKRVSSDL